MKLNLNSNIFDKDDLDYVVDWCFTNWVSSVYFISGDIFVKKFNREPTYEEYAEIFLALFKRLVDEEIILVLPPIKGEPTKKVPNDNANDDFWDVSSDRMIEYIRSVLPKNLKFLNGVLDDKDDEYSKFWYSECPWIRWVDKTDGKIY